MKVECKISAECKEPHAVLHINKMTPAIAEVISVLEKEGLDSPPLIAVRENKIYFIEPEELELVMKNGIEDYISRNFRKSFKERLGLK